MASTSRYKPVQRTATNFNLFDSSFIVSCRLELEKIKGKTVIIYRTLNRQDFTKQNLPYRFQILA